MLSGEDAAHIVERRRLRRRLGFWRILAILAIVVGAAACMWNAAPPSGPRVAEFRVEGVITSSPARDARLREIAEDDDIQAVLLAIDSPGGTLAGSEALYEEVRAVAARKPVVAVVGEVAASGGYITALAADRIFARGGSITGSIGVISQFPVVEEALEALGIQMLRIASSPLKAVPDGIHEPSLEAVAAQEAIIADAYDWFLDLVRERREMGAQQALTVGDGRVFTGRQALENGLIDAIGGEGEALDWLSEARDVGSGLPLVRVWPEEDERLDLVERLLGRAADAAARALRLGGGVWAVQG